MTGGLLQRLLGGGSSAGSGGAATAAAAANATPPDIAADDLVDVRFDESQRGEAELTQLFDGYERALRFDRQVADEVLAAFFDRFASACAAWQPTPAAVEALESARAAAAAAVAAAAADPGSGKAAGQGSMGRRAQMRLVLGCSGGHPRALLAALVEGLERAPRALGAGAAGAALGGGEAAAAAAGEPPGAASAAAPEHAEARGAAPGPPGPVQQKDSALVHAAGLPLLRALRVLQRSAHNRAVLSSLGLLPTLCQLVRQLTQKLQAAAGVLALCSVEAAAVPSSSASIGSADDAAAAPAGPLRLLRPLLALLCEALLSCQELAEAEAAHHRQAALLASRAGSRAASHAAQAAAAQAASASAAAAAAARTARAVAPLVERGMLALCCELLPVAQRIQLHSSNGEGSSGNQRLQQAAQGPAAAGAAELEQRALLCLLALQAASPQAAAAALVQQAGGQGLATLVSLVGWPLASAEHQLPLSTAAVSSSANLAGAAAPAAAQVLQEGQRAQQQQDAQQQQQQLAVQPDVQAFRSRHVRIASGSGLRPAAAELQLQLLAVRAVGAAARGGGGAALHLLQQRACFLRIMQLLQWAALTFDPAGPRPSRPASAETEKGPAQSLPQAGKAADGGGQEGLELQRLFQALWGWVSSGGSSGTAKALLPLVLGAILAAFRPASEAGSAAGAGQDDSPHGSKAGGAAFAGAPPLELLEGSELAFHEAAVAALRRGAGSASSDANSGADSGSDAGGARCGCHLQQQALLFVARLLGREQRVLPLLPPACQQLFERQQQAALARGVGAQTSGSEALANLAALRAAGLWEVAFGPAFFFWGEAQQEQEQEQQRDLQSEQGDASSCAAAPASPAAGASAAGAAVDGDSLRQMVLLFLEVAATLPSSSSNLPEVASLLRLLRQHPRRHGTTAAVCRLLLRLLGSAPATTLAALQEQQLLGALPRLLAAQQQAEGGGGEGGAAGVAGAAGPPGTAGDAAALEDARCAALELLGGFMSMHVSMQRAAVEAWEPVAALFAQLLTAAPASRRLALDSVLMLMLVPPASEDDRLAKAALFTKYTETLPAAVGRWRQLGVPLLGELLGGMRAVAGAGGSGERAYVQGLFCQAQACLQVCNVLNEEYAQDDAAELCCAVLDTLTALVAGSPANRRALAETVGYGTLLEAMLRRLGGAPPRRALLLSSLGLLLEEVPGAGSPPRFASTTLANPPALALLLALLRHASWEDQLWGLAALRELLLQGADNLEAADASGLNSLVIDWLQESVQDAAAAAGSSSGASGSSIESGNVTAAGGPDEGQAAGEGECKVLLLRQQLLALLRQSGSYSISARDLRLLLQLLRPGSGGQPPQHAAALLEALAAMATHTSGPSCFFNFSSGSNCTASSRHQGGASARQQQQPSGIVCSASLGGGTASGGAAAGSGSSAAFLRLPKHGYSFSLWVCLEDGREAGEQLQASHAQSASAAAAGQSPAAGGGGPAAGLALAGAASDQALFALLQQQQTSGGQQHPHFPFQHAQQHTLSGVALAVRRLDSLDSARSRGSASQDGGHPSRQQRPSLQLVAHCWAPKHAEVALPLQQPLVPGRWHHLAVTHSAGGALSHPELQLYLDGQLQAAARLRYPALKEPLSSVCVGAGALLRPLRGQAGAALLFEDVLSAAQVAALHQLGPDYQSPLIASESSGLLDQHTAAAAALALGGGLAAAATNATAPAAPQGPPPRLLLAFCPKLAAAAAAADASAGGGARQAGSRVTRDAVAGRPAALLTGTQLCRTRQPADMLHCLGGVAVLLPLLEQGSGGGGGGEVAAGVLRLLAAMLRGSPGNQQAMQEIEGFALVSHLLEQQAGLLGPQLLAAQQQLLACVAGSRLLGQAVLGHLLLNLRLWSAAAPATQRQLLGLWGQLAAGEPLLVRSLMPPAQILHHVRACFFSGGAVMREQARRRPAGLAQQQTLRGATEAAAAPSAAAAQGQGQELDAQSDAAASAAEAAELRRGYVHLAATLMGESAAAAARHGGLEAGGGAAASDPQSTSSSPVSARDEGLGADLQAALSLLADCCTSLAVRGSGGDDDSAGSSGAEGSPAGGGSPAGDKALLQELLTLLLLPLLRRDSLARLPLLACLRRTGGPALLLPLLRLEQQQLRLLGLRAITACLSAAEGDQVADPSGSSGSGPSRARSTTPEASGRCSSLGSLSPQGPGGESEQNDDVIAAAGRLLAAQPLTAATRIALLEMLCDGAPWTQIDALAPAGPPAAAVDAAASGDGTEDEDPAAAAALVRVRHPGAAAVLLQLSAAPGCSARERAAVLGMLCLLCESASLSRQARHANQDMLAAAPCCWQRLLLGCLRCGSPGAGMAAGSTASGSEERQAAASAWRLLVLLLAHGVAASPAGGERLLKLVSLLKAAPPGALYSCPVARSSGDGGGVGAVGAWQLLQELLADIVQELLHAQAEEAAASEAPDSDSPHAPLSPRGAAAAVARAAAAGVQRAFSAGHEVQPARRARRATSSEWDAWTHVSQWSTEPYCSNAAALLSLLDDCLSGTVLAPPGGALAPGGSALLWADPSAQPAGQPGVGPSLGDATPAAVDGIPPPAWEELGAASKQQPHSSPRLLLAAWHFLDRLHSSGCAAAAAAAALSHHLPAAALPAAVPAPGLGEQQLQRHQQQRALLLLQRLLLRDLQAAPPEAALQAAAQASQLLPPLLADAAADAGAADAAAGRMQLMLAAVVQCYRDVAARAAVAQQQEHLLPLQLQQRLGACMAAANSIVEAAPWAWGDAQATPIPQPATAGQQQQQQEQQQRPRSMQELLPLLQPAVVLAAARQQLQFMRHCCAVHERAVPAVQAAIQAAEQQQAERAAAAEEASQQRLGLLLAADRLRRAAGRQAADEQRQLRRRQWRDLRRGLTSGRGLWAEEDDPEELHWKLDAVEDPSRRRMRLRRNFRFERYLDGPRAGKGSATALAAAAAGAEPEEQELLAVAALVPGGSQAIASPPLQGEDGEEEAEGSEEGEPQAAGSGPGQLQQQADAGTEQGPAAGAQSASERQAGGLEAIPEAHPAQQPPVAEIGAPASWQREQPGLDRQAAAVEAPQPAQPLPTLPQQEAQQQAPKEQAVQQQQEQQAKEQHAAQQQAVPQQAVRQQQQRAAEQPGAEQQAAGAPQVSVLTSEEVEAPPQVGAAPVLFSSRCQWVTPKWLVPGQLHITPTALHFVGDAPGGGTSLAPWLSGGRAGAALYGPEGGSTAGAGGGEGEAGDGAPPRRRHRHWPLEGLTEVHHSRYLLQPTALECFMADRRSHALFNLPSSQAMHAAAAALQRARPSAVVYDRRRKVEWALRLQQRWLRWEISSFEYLMALNTLAGRTYSDLNQYPVFPWVLADYCSPSLDLTSPASFRDLSKPMGALDERRLQFFRERFEGLRADQRHGGGAADGAPHLPPFHYGSHYSSAGIVLFYLVRMEGFTKLNRALQGGRFDHGDRLFHSLPATWSGCLDNTADVKELIPEFYYCPEFLRNSNGFDLGVRQDGLPLGDVVLPPWARGSAEEFVRVMREALESEHVSQNLHSWIDLIFGCKQRGQAAEDACNVFYFLTYEGAVDLDAIQDPAVRAAVEEQILHFGQTPMQLFRRRHPQRGAPPPPSLNPLLNGPDAMRRSALVLPPPHRSGVPLSQLWVVDGRVTQMFGDGAVGTARWCPGGRHDQGAFTFSTAGLLLDTSGSTIEPDPTPPRLLAGAWAAAPAAEPGGCGSPAGRRQLEPQYALIHGDRAVLSGGYWDGSLRVHSPEDGRLLQSLCYHKDAVTCLAASADGAVVVTGSADTTLMVWEASPAFGRAARGRQPPTLPLLPRPRCSLYGHSDAVACVAVSPELDLVVSGAADGSILLHSLGTGRYVRSLALPLGVPPTLLRLVPSIGAILVHSHVDLQLHLYTANCRHLASADTHERLAAMVPSPDGRLLLAGGTSGLATLRWLHSLKPVLRYDAGRGPINALALTPEGCFLAGTTEGSVVLFAPDPRRRITRRFNLAA